MASRVAVLIGAGALSLSAACASTIPHAKKLASAGAAYGRATDKLIGVAEETSLDADSARLLSEAQGLSREDRRALLEKHAAAADLVGELEKLRKHSRLLTRYFEALGALADDTVDTEAANQINGIAGSLNSAGQALSGSKLLSPAETDLISKAGRLTVRAVRSAALSRELAARADTIDRELRIQQAFLAALRRKVQADLASIASLGRERDITRPFLEGSIADQRAWIELRRSYVLAPRSVEALSDASEAASKLRSAWAAFVEGRVDESALLSDLEAVISFAESAKAVLP
ncbi:MAG TPA: hypothetical protein VKH43_08390 [Thermoanaerobaculia bacterium]|nr:hypothetical protein [Thermoanaerobaculia bacterium]